MLPILGRSKIPYARRILNLAPPYYWKFNETSGVTARNSGSVGAAGDVTYTGCTLAQMDVPGGGKAPLFDGVNDGILLGNVLDVNEGTVCMYAKVADAAAWSDADYRPLWVTNDGSNKIIAIWNAGHDNIGCAMGQWGADYVQRVYPTTTLSWFHVAIPWSQSGNACRLFVNGSQIGADLAFKTTTSPTGTMIGQWGGNLYVWKGYIAHVANWPSALNSFQIAKLYIGGF